MMRQFIIFIDQSIISHISINQGIRRQMDLDYLENALQNMELKNELIRNVADYCMTNNVDNELQISNLIDKHFFRHKDARAKTALFLLSSELFILANLRKNKQFFKHLAPKVRPFLDQLFSEAMENLELGGLITGSVEKWAADQLFAQSFMEKIKDVTSPIFNKIQEQLAGGGKHEKFLKYKKTFLMELMDVKKFTPTAHLYDTFVNMNDINLKLNSFQQAYNKIDFQNPSEDSMKRAKQLQRVAEEYRDKLQNLIMDLHKGFRMVSEECRDDFSRLQTSGPTQP